MKKLPTFDQNPVKNWPHLHLFIWGKIGEENVFDDILEKNNAFSDYENNKLIR